MSDKEVMYDVKNYVATITINRPKTLNAFTGDNIKEMESLLAQAAADPKVGVIVLTGTGERAFCVGGDVNWEKGTGGKSGLQVLDFHFNRQIAECPKPVIARVNGYAIGAGHHIAYFCDYTIAAEHAIFPRTARAWARLPGATSCRTRPTCSATSVRASCGCCAAATPRSRPTIGAWRTPSCPWPNSTKKCRRSARNISRFRPPASRS